MSRSGVYRTLAAIAAVASLASCNSNADNQNVAANQSAANQALGGYPGVVDFADALGPIQINVTCSNTPAGTMGSIGVADQNGIPAWTFKVKKKDPISWEVPPTVTIDSIKSKTAFPLPLDPDGDQGGTPGKSYKSKVQDSNKPPTDYHYNIFVTCNPATGAPLHLKIDPEMIVH